MKNKRKIILLPLNFNFVMYFIFSALFFVVSLGFTYLIELVSKIAVEEQHDLITAAVVWLAVYAAVSFGIRYGFLYFRKKACCKWNMDVKTGLMNNILARSPAAFKEKDRTYYMSLFNNDIGFLQKNYVEMIADMVTQMTTFVIALIYAMNINILFTVLILAAGAISVLVTNKLSDQASKHNKTYMDALGSYNEAVDDGLRGYPVIYKSNALKNFMKLFNERTKMNEKYHAKSEFMTSILNSFVNYFSAIVQMLLMFASALFVIGGQMEAVYFPVTLSLMNILISPMYMVMNDYSLIKSCKDIKLNMIKELNFPAELYDGAAAIDEASIDIEHMCFAYGDKTIFSDVNLTVKNKEHVLLRGGSGAGKSTLLKLLTRECTTDGGTIRIGGADIKTLGRSELFKNISVIAQHPMLFRDTILQNIVLFEDKEKIDFERLNKAVDLAGLRTFVDKLPKGLSTVLLDSGENLSGGEKQRIETARAIYRNTPIVLVDEATSGLDLEKAKDLERIFRGMDKLIISTSHRQDINLSELYDRTIVIEDGKIH